MKKLQILGSENTSDSLWLKVEGKKETLQKLDLIFNLYELIPSGGIHGKISYKSWLKKNPKYYLIDTQACLVYIILTPDIIHMIIRKIKKFEATKNLILDYFTFNGT